MTIVHNIIMSQTSAIIQAAWIILIQPEVSLFLRIGIKVFPIYTEGSSFQYNIE